MLKFVGVLDNPHHLKKKRKQFPGFRIMSYRSTTGSLGEQEMLWEHITPLANVSIVRWPLGVTAQPNISWHNQTSHGTTKYLTAQPKTLTAQPNICCTQLTAPVVLN